MVKFSSEELNFIKYFEAQTGAIVKDCILKDDITVIVKEGDVQLAIGKNGSRINNLKREIGKEIHVYEFSGDLTTFIAHLFYPVRVEKVILNGKDIKVYIDIAEKRRAIGRERKKLNTVTELVKRHYDIDNIMVA